MSVTINASTSAGLIQTADTSGTVEIQSNGTTRLTVASGGVTANNLTATGTFGGGVITSGTAVASTSGTSIDFTGIPSWVKRITVMFSGVSTNGTSSLLVQIGAGSVTASGYNGTGSRVGNGTATVATSSTAGMLIATFAATNIVNGQCVISTLGSNVWGMSAMAADSNSVVTYNSGSSVTLAGTLDRVRITTVGGTDTFDAGTINILYEG